MKRNWKFHAMAIAAISAIIIVLYLIIGPTKVVAPGDPTLVGDRYIQIYTATWGMNCNDYIDKLNEQRRLHIVRPGQQDPNSTAEEQEAITAEKPLARVATDNALIALSNLCNGKLECNFVATSNNLGGEPLSACFKRLVVGFRCFTYDRMRQFDVGQGESVSIDCHE